MPSTMWAFGIASRCGRLRCVCLQGVVIALSCIIFSAISSSPPAVDTGASVVTAVWTYVGELAFNLLVLVGAIKGCDRIVKEIMGL